MRTRSGISSSIPLERSDWVSHLSALRAGVSSRSLTAQPPGDRRAWNAPMNDHPELRIALVTEAFLDRPLPELLNWLLDEAPEITALELGSGGYAPHPHCDREALLRDAGY